MVEAKLGLRLCIALYDRVLLPASTYFESPLAREILDLHPLSCAVGRVQLTASEPTLADHRESKVDQYGDSSPLDLGSAYSTRSPRSTEVGYVRKEGTSRQDIEVNWNNTLIRALDDVEYRSAVGLSDLSDPLVASWVDLPYALGERAFIPGHVYQLIERQTSAAVPIGLRFPIYRLIERAYIASYMNAHHAGLLEDLVFLRTPFDLPPSWRSVNYQVLVRSAMLAGVLEPLALGSEQLLLRSLHELREVLLKQPSNSGDIQGARSNMSLVPDPTIAVVTALAIEHEAVRLTLSDVEMVKVPGDPQDYTVGWIEGEDKNLRSVVLVQIPRMGNPAAASASTNLMRSFPSVRDVVMCGIAGGLPDCTRPDRDIRLGDVVVSDRRGVVDLDSVAYRPGGISEDRSLLPPPSARLTRGLNRISQLYTRGERPIDSVLAMLTEKNDIFRKPESDDVLTGPGGAPTERAIRPQAGPKLFRGVVASSQALLKDPVRRDQIRDSVGVFAAEMEGGGVAESTWAADGRGFIAVRGISDYCDNAPKDWHSYASATAAAATYILIGMV